MIVSPLGEFERSAISEVDDFMKLTEIINQAMLSNEV